MEPFTNEAASEQSQTAASATSSGRQPGGDGVPNKLSAASERYDLFEKIKEAIARKGEAQSCRY